MKKPILGAFLLVLGCLAVLWGRRELQAPPAPESAANVVSAVKKEKKADPQAPLGQPNPISAAVPVAPADEAKARLAEEILRSRNDNDPRLDTELRVLTPGAKELLKASYQRYAPEKRNERGTLVFLVGRNLTSESDFEFLKAVLGEPPCRSMESCARDAQGSVPSEELHHEGGDAVTLAYPQLVALRSIDSFLSSKPTDETLVAAALRNLEEARHSPVERVAAAAEEILSRRRN